MSRRRLMQSQNSELPSGYTRCKYLESSGKQWIDTVVYPSSKMTIYTCIMGAYSEVNWYGGRDIGNIGIFNYNGRFDYGRISELYINPSPYIFHDIIHGLKIYIDGNLKYTAEEMDFVSSTTLWLFSGNMPKILYSRPSAIKMQYFRIMEGSILIRNFIPTLDTSGRPCMYDTVTHQPFYNQGTGEFGYELMDGTYVAPV